MSTRNISWDKGGRCVGLITLPPSFLKSGSLNLLETSGPAKACIGFALPLNGGYIKKCIIISFEKFQRR
jgi:hypothetical protein